MYKEYPAMKVLSTLYVGPYKKEGPIYEMMQKYMKDNNLQYTCVPWEFYLTPQHEKDPNKLQTLIYFQLK
jgi:effector-binding domain-containing protein